MIVGFGVVNRERSQVFRTMMKNVKSLECVYDTIRTGGNGIKLDIKMGMVILDDSLFQTISIKCT